MNAEKALIDVLGYSYEAAHEFAAIAGHRTIHRMGITPKKFHDTLGPWAKRDAVEKISVPPGDLDRVAYRGPDQDAGDRRILARLQELGSRMPKLRMR
jgi:hypothetical protein